MVTPEQVIADALAGRGVSGNLLVSAAPDIATALRAAGLLPGPDDIVVSREALATYLQPRTEVKTIAQAEAMCAARDHLAAALSQPHPAQEQQT